ncbi:MAG: calcium/sodium antiporter [Shewanellaceae bacterium]|nr:calcium/sodium antiporter [Shewanellaceae bacterium]
MLLHVGLLILGLLLLIWSADKFVMGASALARQLGLSPFIIGLTIVAVGSSAPEMFVAGAAALNHQNDTAIGNVLGSNITNLLLILGATAVVRKILVSSTTLMREVPLVLLASLVGAWVLYDRYLTRAEGVGLLVLFVLIMGFLIGDALRQKKRHEVDPLTHYYDEASPDNLSTKQATCWLLLGMVLLPLSAQAMVIGASAIASYFGMSDLMIGLTIIAIGTSLPELAASITSVLKGQYDLAIGNTLGSNLFNILAVLAIPAFLNPDPNHPIDLLATTRDVYVMLGATLLVMILLFVSKRPYHLSRWQGVLLLCCFISYQSYLIDTLP